MPEFSLRRAVSLSAATMTCSLFLAATGSGQCEPELRWQQTHGTADYEDARGTDLTGDGGYVITGTRQTGGQYDYWVVKVDSSGTLVWESVIGDGGEQRGTAIRQTSDGGYIVAGYDQPTSNIDTRDATLLKLDPSGSVVWTQNYGGNKAEWAEDVKQTTDGGYVLIGFTRTQSGGYQDWFVVKTDAVGGVQWQTKLGGGAGDGGISVQQTADGGYILGGWAYSFGPGTCAMWLVKLDSAGNRQWDRSFGGGGYDWGYSVLQAADGGYVLGGATNSRGAGDYDMYLVKTDSSGTLQWDKTYGGSREDWGRSVIQTPDGGYAFAGRSRSFGAGDYEIVLVRVDACGKELWQKTFGGAADDGSETNSLRQLRDGSYVISGWTESFGAGDRDAWLLKLSSEFCAPIVESVLPSRGRYDDPIGVEIRGQGFLGVPEGDSPGGPSSPLTVRFGSIDATNVSVLDDRTLICDGPTTESSGSVDISVANQLGTGTLENGFSYTPSLGLSGNWVPGGDVTLTWLLDPRDDVFAIHGLPPVQSIDTPPFDGQLCILPFENLFFVPDWPYDEFIQTFNIPNNPNLSGLDVLFQGLIGPSFGAPKDAAWTNCEMMSIR